MVCSGEPGIGKTRLAEELATRPGARGVPVLWGRAAEDGAAPAFWPWRQLLAALRANGLERPGAHEGADDAARARFRFFDAVSAAVTSTAARAGLVVLDDMHGADRPSVLLLRQWP